ncbi:major capsid protein, partial [Jatrophihabitans endophyticus]|uniref:major capsid protein n=1 Tax=Jatrophihabitans endophyticus TaxID=1206085 RepID=UPI0019F78D9C
ANVIQTLEGKIADKMAKHLRAMDATLEHQRCGALKGLVVDKNGAVLADLYQTYGITAPAPIEFELSSATFPVRKTCALVQEQVEDALDEPTGVDGLHAFCGADFWNNLIENEEVRSTYLNQVQAAQLRGNAWGGDLFIYGGITFERYRVGVRATASAAPQSPASATNSPAGFIGRNEVRFVPKAPELFLTRFGPADYIETVNSPGLPRYAKQIPRLDGKGIDIQVQTNAMSWCTRPEALLGGFSD